MRKLSALVVGVLGVVLLSPGTAPASHCNPNGPIAVIASAYYATGGIGALDSAGCAEGDQVADTRVMLPSADFVLLILTGSSCSPGASTKTGRIDAKGGFNGVAWDNVNITLTCDATGTNYISEILDTRCGLLGRAEIVTPGPPPAGGIVVSPGGHPPTCAPPSGWMEGIVFNAAGTQSRAACTKTIDRTANCGGTA